MRQAFDKGFFVGGALASMMTVTKGRAPERPLPDASERRRAAQEDGSRRRAIRQPDGKYIFDKLSSVFASGNRTRDDQPNHLRVRTTRAPPGRRGVGVDVPRARVRGRPRRRRRDGHGRDHAVELRPVRRDHREGRPPDAARGRLGPRVHRDVGSEAQAAVQVVRGQRRARETASRRRRRSAVAAYARAIAMRSASAGCVPTMSCTQPGGSGSPRPSPRSRA